MKKILGISLIVALLLMSGCEKKENQSEQVTKETKQSITKKLKENKTTQVKSVKNINQQNHESTKKEANIDAAKLYVKCAGCHGTKGDKKALGKSGIINTKSKDELVKLIKGYKAGTLNQYGMGALMHGQVGNLSDNEIEALAEYISNLK